jgi:septal ring factor EnvC (AmiA/AmiB activator)
MARVPCAGFYPCCSDTNWTLHQCQMHGIDNRLASLVNWLDVIDQKTDGIEQQVAETNSRIDRGFKKQSEIAQKQSEIAQKMSQAEADVSYLRQRIDMIARKLEASDPFFRQPRP